MGDKHGGLQRHLVSFQEASEGFEETAYYDPESLRIFLNSLSYHRVGSAFFAKQIKLLRPPERWNLLDVGCGDGQFTEVLLEELRERQAVPTRIRGIDPSRENLRLFRERLSRFREVAVACTTGKVESLPIGKWFIVMLSHSLYGFLENSKYTESFKDGKLRFLLRLVENGGALMVSLASKTSVAYQFKRGALKIADVADRSIFGEDVIARLDRLGIACSTVVRNSYMDVTRLILSEEGGLSDWTRYFCRLTSEQVQDIGLARLRGLLQSLSIRFAELPPDLAHAYELAPAACGPPTPDCLVLPHKECFIVIRSDHQRGSVRSDL